MDWPVQLNFFDVFRNLVGLFLLIAVGYGAVKAGVLSVKASETLTQLLMQVTLPCTIFVSLLRDYDSGFARKILFLILLGFILFPLNAVLAKPFARLFCVERNRRGVWEFASTYCNNGFMGFPITLALFGSEGLAQAALFGIPFNVLIYTVGAGCICNDVKTKEGCGFQWKKVLLTGVNLSTVLGLIFYFGRLQMPDMLLTPIQHLSNITTPVSMIITGINLTRSSILETFRCRDAFTASITRLVILPLVSYGILLVWGKLIGFGDSIMFGVIFVIMCMPTAAACTSLTEMYGADKEFAARCVFLSSLFCIITIPAMSLLL